MTAQERGTRDEESADVPDVTGDVSRRRLLRRGAMGAGLAVAGGALLRPDAASANNGDPVLAGQPITNLTTETSLAGSASPSMLRLAQASASDDGLVVQLSASNASGTGVKVSQAGTGPAIGATTSGTNNDSAITAQGTASLAANTGVVDAVNNSTATNAYAVRATSTGAGGGMFASASSAPAVSAQSSGSAAALFAKNTGSGPGVSVTTTNNGAALLLTSGGTAILASSQFSGTPSGVADKAGISITGQTATGTYVKTTGGRAVYAENSGINDTIYATNTGNSSKPHAVTGYLPNPSGAGSAIYGSTGGTGAGIEGKSNHGRGGQFTGRVAQIRLLPGTGPHPASGSAGDLFVDNHGALWFCKGGTNWKQIA